jgi:hypothetical protein
MPDASPSAVGLPRCKVSTSIHPSPAAAAAAWVAANADPASALLAPALPPLNPNHPNHSRPAPSRVRTMLLGWMTLLG